MIDKAHGVMFHHFHDEDRHPKGQGSISGNEFRRLLTWVDNNHTILSAKAWHKKVLDRTLDKTDVCITFDDNLQCQQDVAMPILNEMGIKAFWFVYSSPLQGVTEKLELYRYFRFDQFATVDEFYLAFDRTVESSEWKHEVESRLSSINIDKYLSAFSFYTKKDRKFRYMRDQIFGPKAYYELMDQMIEQSNMDVEQVAKNLWIDRSKVGQLIEQGHVVGLHSHTHPTQMEKLSRDQQLKEYSTNLSILKSIAGQDIKTMSHPCNSYNNDTLDVLNELGVNLGFRANLEASYESNLELPRIDHMLLMPHIQ